MKPFFGKKDVASRKKRIAIALLVIIAVVVVYVIISRKPAPQPEPPVVEIEPVIEDDVEIYGEYVGRIRAQQFVEVHARVEGYLEQMLFEEGTYVTKNQVLFVINQDQYKAKVDKVRAQLRKMKLRLKRQNVIWNVCALCMNKMQPVSWT